MDKASFQQNTTYADFKDLPRRTTADKILRDKIFKIARNPSYDGYQSAFVSIVCKFFDKKSSGSVLKVNLC